MWHLVRYGGEDLQAPSDRDDSHCYQHTSMRRVEFLLLASTLCIPRHLGWREYIWLWSLLHAPVILSCDVCVDECGVASRLLWR